MIELRHQELSDLKSMKAVFAIPEATVRIYESDIGGVPAGASPDGTFPLSSSPPAPMTIGAPGSGASYAMTSAGFPKGTQAYRLTRNGKTGDPTP